MPRVQSSIAGARSVVPTQPRHWFPFVMAAAVVTLVWWSARGTEVDLPLLFRDGPQAMLSYARKLFPPDLRPEFLLDTAFGAVFFASANLMYAGVLFEREAAGRTRRGLRLSLYLGAKSLLNLLRTIPEIVWATVFVFAVGLGPFPGVLALGVHNGGVLGKLFGEVLENVDRRPIEALQATGATRFQILVYGILPQALPHFLAYALYRWEVNIRAAAMLGLVGAGGLGQRLHIAISLFLEHQLLTLLLAIYVIVTAVDYLSAYLRRLII